MITKAVIVAAGLSSRLYPLTLEKPKGLLPINGEAMLQRSINILKKNGIGQIALVVGYKHDVMRNTLGDQVEYIINPFYRHCNNMGTLWFARDFVHGEPFVYLHGDIVYHEEILSTTLKENRIEEHAIELVTDFGPTDEEAMKVKVDRDRYLIESNKEIRQEESAGEWTGIAYINQPEPLFEEIERIMLEEDLNVYDTHAFTKLAQKGKRIYCSSTADLPWIEVDFQEDYQKAQRMFTDEPV